MFQVTTLDMDNVPKTDDGKVDYAQDFFGKQTSLTVSGQLNGETYAHGIPVTSIHLDRHSVQRILIRHVMQQSSG